MILTMPMFLAVQGGKDVFDIYASFGPSDSEYCRFMEMVRDNYIRHVCCTPEVEFGLQWL